MSINKSNYSKREIRNAGRALAENNITPNEKKSAVMIVNDFRADHAYPLNAFYKSIKKCSEQFEEAVAAQRLKRLESIIGKLRRQPNMGLDTMQDLGGCRLILKKPDDLLLAVSKVKEANKSRMLLKTFDYIENPKTSGYRSIHLVYAYKAKKNNVHDGLKIEIQLRTELQHAWATAVEILSMRKGADFKASEGDGDILRYMELMSALFAIEEGFPSGGHVPSTGDEIFKEMCTLNGNGILDTLNLTKFVIDVANSVTGAKAKKDRYYLFKFDLIEHKGKIYSFAEAEDEEAAEMYRLYESDETVMCVLVSTSGIVDLKKTYPNYFTDINIFMEEAFKIIKKYESRI